MSVFPLQRQSEAGWTNERRKGKGSGPQEACSRSPAWRPRYPLPRSLLCPPSRPCSWHLSRNVGTHSHICIVQTDRNGGLMDSSELGGSPPFGEKRARLFPHGQYPDERRIHVAKRHEFLGVKFVYIGRQSRLLFVFPAPSPPYNATMDISCALHVAFPKLWPRFLSKCAAFCTNS